MVRAAVAGDEAARDEIARRMDCIPMFLADVHRKGGRSPLDDAALEELARNVVVSVWQRLDSFEGHARLETWIYRFCEFTISNAIRKRAPVTLSIDTDREPEGAEDQGDTLASEDAARVREAVDRLGGMEAAVLTLRYFEDRRFDEIAERLGVSIHVVKRTHVKGLRRLEARLGAGFRPDER